MRTAVPDTSVLLAFYLPGEPYKEACLAVLRAYVDGRLHLVVPVLSHFEFLSGLSRSVRGLRTGERLAIEEAYAILRAFRALRIDAVHVEGMEDEILEVSVRMGCSAYDAVYLVLAARNGWEMITADDRFFRNVSGRFPLVHRAEDFASTL